MRKPRSYVHGKNIVKALEVSTDSAEQGAKQASHFQPMWMLEKKYQNIPQLTKENRKKGVNQRKQSVASDEWLLIE